MGKIYLFGEHHSKRDINEEELRIWKKFYDEKGMRHLFIESPYFASQMYNRWMKSDNDELLLKEFENLKGTLAYDPCTLDFYRFIKKNCPETVFHGTDVGHQYATTGVWYLEYLESLGLKDTEEYRLSKESHDQGFNYRGNGVKDRRYRETMMGDNFIASYERLGRPDIMGIYGSAHMNKDGMVEDIPRFIVKLLNKYGDDIILTNLSKQFGYSK